ncbi:hypothetical protein WJX74_011052 [Apatococcus lobatus]|uniref:RING-type E3 ubiquitin transferase n=1 Tax=Apatococcus lobatus TaxID=904363 RepID=A0AAW1RSW6_9CHLO
MPSPSGFLDLPSIPNFQGWTIGREEIQILETLGQGGYGKVHKARLFGTDIVAVKELNDPTPAHEEQFQGEVAILSSLRSPYIVQFLGASLVQGSAMLITEYCERGDLYRAIKNDQGTGMLSWYRRGKHIALDIAKGLFFMHRNHIIHFDIKSPNILLTSTLQAKIADVGISKHSTRSSTEVEGGIGSFDWVSPEQIMMEGCTSKVDVFSFGVVLWEIVTGDRPRRGQNRPPEVPRQCPAAVARLIEECQARDPQDRPTAPLVLQTLLSLQEQEDAARGRPPPPSNYICPITQALMEDPVILVQTSIAYERAAIKKWLSDGHRQCPATGLPIAPPFLLLSDASLQKAIQRWLANNPSANDVLPASSASPCPTASVPAADGLTAGSTSAAPQQTDAADLPSVPPVPRSSQPARSATPARSGPGISGAPADVPYIIERRADENGGLGAAASAAAAAGRLPSGNAAAAQPGPEASAGRQHDRALPGRRRLLEVSAAPAFSSNNSQSGGGSLSSNAAERTLSGSQTSQAQSRTKPSEVAGMNRLTLRDHTASAASGRRSMRQSPSAGAIPLLTAQGSTAQGGARGSFRDRSPSSKDHTAPLDVNADGEPILAAQDLASELPAPDLPRMFRRGSSGAAARRAGLYASGSAPEGAEAATTAGGASADGIERSGSAVHQRSSQPRRAGSLVQPGGRPPSPAPSMQRSQSQATPRPAPAAALPASGKPQLDAQLAAVTDPDSHIVDLDLQWEAIGPQGAVAVAAAVALAPSLQRLNLEGNSLSIAGAGAVLDALPACSSLRELVLSNNSLGTGVLTNLATVLVRCGALQHLSLSNVNAQSQGVSSLCQALLRPTCGVTHLDLASNALQPEVGSILAEVVRSTEGRLESILLQNNQLGETGCLALVTAAMTRERPCTLNLANNGLPFASTRKLRAMLRRSSGAGAIQL